MEVIVNLKLATQDPGFLSIWIGSCASVLYRSLDLQWSPHTSKRICVPSESKIRYGNNSQLGGIVKCSMIRICTVQTKTGNVVLSFRRNLHLIRVSFVVLCREFLFFSTQNLKDKYDTRLNFISKKRKGEAFTSYQYLKIYMIVGKTNTPTKFLTSQAYFKTWARVVSAQALWPQLSSCSAGSPLNAALSLIYPCRTQSVRIKRRTSPNTWCLSLHT